MIRMVSLLTLLMMSWLLGGCASAPPGAPEAPPRHAAVEATPGKAQIVVYRHESLGFAVPMTVRLDGRIGGRTVGQTYVRWEVEPGRHEISSHAEDASSLTVDAEAGRTYFIWQEVKVGFWKARSTLHRVDEETGRREAAVCRRAQA